MSQRLPWTPWHRVVKLREDVRTGELSLADFAADLHDVMMQRGARPIYEDPARFFALTYPTFSLRELARDIVLRLAGRNTKAVRQPRADLRRRQDPHPGGAAPSRARSGVAAEPASGGAVQVRRRRGVAAGAGRGARLRQAGRREGDGGTRAARRAALAEASLERARFPDRRRGRDPGAARRGQGRGARDGARRAAAGRSAVPAPGRGAGDAGADRRGADVPRAARSRWTRRGAAGCSTSFSICARR